MPEPDPRYLSGEPIAPCGLTPEDVREACTIGDDAPTKPLELIVAERTIARLTAERNYIRCLAVGEIVNRLLDRGANVESAHAEAESLVASELKSFRKAYDGVTTASPSLADQSPVPHVRANDRE